jgi:vancomycin permeability regulator SanA
VADTPAEPVAIVLGAGLNADGSPKLYLKVRLADTLRLDVVVDADPKYLGKHETGVDRALSIP